MALVTGLSGSNYDPPEIVDNQAAAAPTPSEVKPDNPTVGENPVAEINSPGNPPGPKRQGADPELDSNLIKAMLFPSQPHTAGAAPVSQAFVPSGVQPQAAPYAHKKIDMKPTAVEGDTTNMGVPTPDGVPAYSGGHGLGTKAWMERMEGHSQEFAKARQKLDKTSEDYFKTRSEDQRNVSVSMQKDVPRGVQELDKASGGRVAQGTADYQKAMGASKEALAARSKAGHVADAAMEHYKIAESTVEVHKKEFERQALQDQKAKLQKGPQLPMDADKALDVAKSLAKIDTEPWKFMEGAVKLIAGGALSAGAQQEVAEVTGKISAIDDKLTGKLPKMTDGPEKDKLTAEADKLAEKAKNGPLEGKDKERFEELRGVKGADDIGALREAKAKLQGSVQGIVEADIKHRNALNDANRALGNLAAVEKEYGTTTVFRNLQKYNQDMTIGGEKYDAALQEYGQTISHPDVSRRPAEVVGAGELDKLAINNSGLGYNQRVDVVDTINKVENYANQVDAWQKGQHAAIDHDRQRLSRGPDFDVVNQSIQDIRNKDFYDADLARHSGYQTNR